MEKKIFSVPAIHCKHCVHTIEMEVGEMWGIKEVKADLDTKTVSVEFESPADEEKIVDLLKEINYPPEI